MNDGLKIEAAAGVIARDVIKQHLAQFSFAIRTDRVASQTVVAAYIDGLAASVALTIAGKHGSKDEVVELTIKKLREAINRDLDRLKFT